MAPRSGISIMSAEMRQDALTMHQTMKQKMTLADLVPDDSAAAASKKPRSIGVEQEKILQNVFDCFADAKLGRVELHDYNPDKQPGPGEARFVGSGYLRSSERLNDIMHAFGLTRYSGDGDSARMGPGRGFCPHEIMEMTSRFFEEQEVNKFVRKSKQESAHATSSIGKGDKTKKISFLELSMLVSKEPMLARKWDQYYQSRVNDARFRKKQNMEYNKEYDIEPEADGSLGGKHLDPVWQMEQAFKILVESYGKKSPTGSGVQELDIQVLRNVLSSCGDELQVDQFDDFLGMIKHPLRGTLDKERFVNAVKRASHLDSVHFVQEEEPEKQAEPLSRADIEKIYEEAQVYGQDDLEALSEEKLRSIAERKAVSDFATLPMKQLKSGILASQIETRHLVAKEDLPDEDAMAQPDEPKEEPKEEAKGEVKADEAKKDKKVKKEDEPKKKSSKDAPEDKKEKKRKSKDVDPKELEKLGKEEKKDKPKESPRRDKSPKQSPRKDKDDKKDKSPKHSPRKEKDDKKDKPKESPRKEKDDKKDSPRKDKDEKKDRKASPSPEPKEKKKEDK